MHHLRSDRLTVLEVVTIIDRRYFKTGSRLHMVSLSPKSNMAFRFTLYIKLKPLLEPNGLITSLPTGKHV